MVEFTYQPNWLWFAAGSVFLAALIGWFYFSARGAAGSTLRLMLFGLRLLTLATVVVCLLDPERVTPIRHYQPAHIAVLVDTSRSMGWDEGSLTRLDLARNWIKNELKVPANFGVAYYGFSTNLYPLDNLAAAVPVGDRTAFAESLESLSAATRLDPPASIVLLSDGADNSLQSPEAVARAFGARKIPIHTVALGGTNDPPDIVVENIQVKRTLWNQGTSKAIVTLRSPGFAGRMAPVRILKGNEVLAERTVRLAGESQRVEIEFTPRLPGFQTFAAEIPVQPGERLSDNNRREFGLTVVDQKLRVIYMEATGEAEGAFQPLFLKHALEDTPGVQVKTLYVEQNGAPPSLFNQVAYVDPKNGDKIYRVQHPIEGYPKTMEELLKYDAVIFSDVPKSDFTPDQLRNTERFVTEFGGGFVMVGGYTSFGSGGYQNTIIDNLIPVAMERETDLKEYSFQPRVTDDAWTHPIMQISADEAENRIIWTAKFPQLFGYNRVDRAKPGAVVLLEHPTDRTADGPAVILAAQNVGKGRTMAFTSDTTYGWGRSFETIWGEKHNPSLPLNPANCDARYFKQFWLNAVRWLAAHKANQEHGQVSIDLPQTYCAPNVEIPVRVGAVSRDGREVGDAEVTLELSDKYKPRQTVRAIYSEALHGYQAEVKLPDTGQFVLHAVARFKDGQTADDRQIVVGEDADFEMADIRAKPETLAALSRWSGGQVLAAAHNDPSAMSLALGGATPATLEYKKTPLWDRAGWLAAIIGLLTVEWAVRRLRGLA